MTRGSMTISRSVLGSVGLGLLLALVLVAAPASGQTLARFHPGCDRIEKSRHPDCVAAIHRFCSADNRGGAGLAQEVLHPVFGVACFKPSWYGDVPVAQLTRKHPECRLGISQGGGCMAAIHRWCVENRRGGAGLAQEVGNGVLGVACFQPSSYQDVAITNLRALHGGCNDIGKSQHPDCVAAIHRWCVKNRKGDAGLVQEVGPRSFGVACFRTTIYRDLSVSDLGYGILNYARSKMRWCVDAKFKVRPGVCAAPDGECTHLVEAAVISAGARRPNFRAAPYSWGRIVQSSYLPGDIIQFWGGARLEEPQGNGLWFTNDQHTAIIEKTNGRVVTVIHQNSPTRTVTRQDINLGWKLVMGSYVVYRPIAP